AAAVKLLGEAADVARRTSNAAVSESAELNLAAGERELGHLDKAQRHLDALSAETRRDPLAGYVAGLIAADRGDAAQAERLFAAAATAAPDDDYAWDIAYHRGMLAERTGDLITAERFYRAAIDIVEAIRARTTALELRPWMLSQRRAPYEA